MDCTTPKDNTKSVCNGPRVPEDLTFEKCPNDMDSQFIVQAVGEILTEIQKLLAQQNEEHSENAKSTTKLSVEQPRPKKKAVKQPQRTLSDDECVTNMDGVGARDETTYHRRVLDQPVSQIRKPVDCQNGSLNLKEMESNRFPKPVGSTFECPAISSQRSPELTNSKNYGLGNVYNVNRAKVSIGAFVSSFYKRYPIVSPSSFVLSLIYIDRFIKSQCANGLAELNNFSITRLFLVSIILSMKYHEEYYIENAYFFKHASKYCCIYDIRELNSLEILFLEAIDYRLKVAQDELDSYLGLICNKADELQCKKFKVYIKEYTLIDDYFKAPKAPKAPLRQVSSAKSRKLPMVFIGGKLFKSSREAFDFFHCGKICTCSCNNCDETAMTDSSSLYDFSED